MRILVVCILLAGCGGDDGGGPIDIDNLGMELGIASCAKQFDCCTDAEIMEQYMGITHDGQPITTEDQCVTFTNAVFTGLAVVTFKESIAMGRLEYDAAAAGDCVAAIESLSCAEYGTGEIGGLTPCRPFVIPLVADGGACTQDAECTTGNCEGASTPIGGPNTDGVCKPKPSAGQPCDENCTDGNYCGFDQSAGMDVCLALKANGTQCNLDRECMSDHCEMRMCATKAPTCDGR